LIQGWEITPNQISWRIKMSFLLVIVFYSGQVDTTYFKTAEQCEHALIDATDLGRHKLIEDAACLKVEPKGL
jgi:hypothetical protein